MTAEYASILWSKVEDRLTRLYARDRDVERTALLCDIVKAGGTLEVFVLFVECWLGQVNF